MAIIVTTGWEKIQKEYEQALENITGVSEEQTKNMFLMYAPIVEQIKKWCQTNATFNAKVLSTKLTLPTLIRYLYTKVQAKFGENNIKKMGNMALVSDDEVFSWIFEFYDFDGFKMLKQEEEEKKQKEEAAAKAAEKRKKEAAKRIAEKKEKALISSSAEIPKEEPTTSESVDSDNGQLNLMSFLN